MALKITEEWIKKRTKIGHDKLEDVKSLALPGSYHEKIGSLSTSLSNFSRLQQLDVSRNAITSLDGLSHLNYLENLNLYYNQLPDLKELFKLRKNQSLKVLDIRLNPVTKIEPDYRLFVVHMLPLLRMLDDRPVRESERKAALMHFSNEQAAQMDMGKEEQTAEEEDQDSTQPRAGYVRNMIKKPTFVAEEDTCIDVIDLMNRNSSDVSNQRLPTGGVRTRLEIEDHIHAGLMALAQRDEILKRREEFKPRREMNGSANGHIREKDDLYDKSPLHFGTGSSVSRKSAPNRSDVLVDNNDEAYIKFKSVANFTRHPGTVAPPPTMGQRPLETSLHSSSHDSMTSQGSIEEFESLPNVKRLSFGESKSSKCNESVTTKTSVQAKFFEEFLDLVDRYWNGSKSLHYHKKFKSLVEKPLARYEEGLSSSNEIQLRAMHDQVTALKTKNRNLEVKLQSLSKQKASVATEAASQKEHDALRSRLQLSMSDNKILRTKISELEIKLANQDDEKDHHGNDRSMELEKQKRTLMQQVANMKLQVKNSESLEDLTKMLQESHKSLISTNDRLLIELDDTRRRHQSEVEQLKWSYDQLRKTSRLLGSPTSTSNGNDTSHINGF